jgi:hypothetical protein
MTFGPLGGILIGNGEKARDREWYIGSGSALILGMYDTLRQARNHLIHV